MSRVEKGSRIRLLPPKVTLRERDAISGSYPSVVRFSTDGRLGIANLRFNDAPVVLFGITNNNYYPGIGLASGSYWLTGSAARDLPLTTTIITTGSNKSAVVDELPFVEFGDSDPTITQMRPFVDYGDPAVDAISTDDSFYATGSSIAEVGEGFSSPLWSKQRITVDLSVSATVSSSFNTFFSSSGTEGFVSGTNYPMAYYNFANKTWDGIGVGAPVAAGGNTVEGELYVQGFTGGLIDIPSGINYTGSYSNFMDQMFEFQSAAGQVTDKFGFPFAAKYAATSSQLYPLSGTITEPFLVEKIVLEFSGALKFDPNIQNGAPGTAVAHDLTSSFVPASISNFFVLNQRNGFTVDYYNSDYANAGSSGAVFVYTLPSSSFLSSGSSRTTVNSIREIVTYGGISAFASNMTNTAVTRSADAFFVGSPNLTRNPKTLLTRDLVIETGAPLSQSLSSLGWSGSFVLEMPARSPNSVNYNVIPDAAALGGMPAMRNVAGGRNGLGVIQPTGRDFKSPLTTIQTRTVTNLFSENYVLAEGAWATSNPYILLPTDKLVFGWQQPVIISASDWRDITSGTGSQGTDRGNGVISTMSFIGPARVHLYGSYVRENKEQNDSLNQLLSSNSVHEVIGD